MRALALGMTVKVCNGTQWCGLSLESERNEVVMVCVPASRGGVYIKSTQRHLLEDARSQGVGDVSFSTFFRAS